MVGDCNTGYFRRVAGANCTDLSDQYTQFQEFGTLGRSCWRGAPWPSMPAELARFSWPAKGRVIGMDRESMPGGWMQGRQHIKCLFPQGFHRPPMTDGAKAPRTAVFWFAAENVH